MIEITKKALIEARVHIGHLLAKWHPKASPFIFGKINGFHIIDINKSITHLQEATQEIARIVKEGRKILFVGTKKAAKSITKSECEKVNQPYITERWPGGILTNFSTIRKSIKKIHSVEKYTKTQQYKNLTKKERLMINRDNEKLKHILNGVRDMNRIPGAIFIIDPKREHIAVSEAKKMNIPIFALIDTNTDPDTADYPIPANDDAEKAISLILKYITTNIAKALEEQKQQKLTETKEKEENKNTK